MQLHVIRRKMNEKTKRQLKEVASGCLAEATRRTSRKLNQFYAERMRPAGLSGQQFSLMTAIGLLGPVTIGKLAEATSTDRTTLSRNLRLLQERGLMALGPGQDRREQKITLTAAGGRAAARAYHLWLEAQTELISRFGKRRLQNLLGELREVRQILDG